MKCIKCGKEIHGIRVGEVTMAVCQDCEYFREDEVLDPEGNKTRENEVDESEAD